MKKEVCIYKLFEVLKNMFHVFVNYIKLILELDRGLDRYIGIRLVK